MGPIQSLETQTILIADDHPLFRQALVMAATRSCANATVIEAGTLQSALESAQSAKGLSLILLDLKMPGAEGFSGLAMMHAEAPTVPILVISSADPAKAAMETRRFGAVGFIGKDQPLNIIEAAIQDALSGNRFDLPISDEQDSVAAKVAELTPTQLRVLLGVLAGRLNKQIAFDLGITEATVKAHMTAIMRRLDVQNRTQAVLAARSLGLGIEP